MSSSAVNETVARALQRHLDARGMPRKVLAAKAGVSPNTVKNFLEPGKRQEGASGKAPSGKLTELGMIADALGLSVVDLLIDSPGPGDSFGRLLSAPAVELGREFDALPPSAQVVAYHKMQHVLATCREAAGAPPATAARPTAPPADGRETPPGRFRGLP